jgi:hypothetical protein
MELNPKKEIVDDQGLGEAIFNSLEDDETFNFFAKKFNLKRRDEVDIYSENMRSNRICHKCGKKIKKEVAPRQENFVGVPETVYEYHTCNPVRKFFFGLKKIKS